MIGVAVERETPVRIRPAVAVLVSRFPKVTETFVLRELIEMERQGQAVRLVALRRERPEVIHSDAVPWLGRLLHVSPFSAAVVAANLRALVRRPGRCLGLGARLLAGTWRRPGVALRTLALFPIAVALGERLRAEGVGHVHAHFATYSATAAWVIRELAGIEFSFTVHAHDLFVHQLLLREKLAAARFVRAISELNRERLARFAPESADKVVLMRLGVDVEGRDAPPPPASPEPLLLAVAALEEYKGLPVLVDACARLAAGGVRFRCEIIGRGPLRRALERRIRARGLAGRVEMLGARNESEVADRMRASAVVVQPSVVAASGQMEGIPVALMEAMAAGRPVVASRLSGIPELVEDGRQGLLVPPGDAHALADAIQRLLADPELAACMGRAGRERVRERHPLGAATSALLDRLDRELAPVEGGRLLATLDGVERASVRAHQERTDSEIVHLLVAGLGGTRELVLKRHRARAGESAPPEARAAREHELLEELGRSAPAARVPRPLELDRQGATVLLEACAGEPLDERIRRARGGDPRAIRADLEAAGAWLAAYQRAFSPAGSAVARFDEIVRLVATDARRDGACARLERLAASVDRSALRLVRTHGDFWPGNLFVSAAGAQAIDFEGAGVGLAEEDAADFLVELRLFFLRPGARAHCRLATTAFLAGWGGADSPALRLCRMRAARSRLSAPVPRLSAPVRALRRRALAALARGLEAVT